MTLASFLINEGVCLRICCLDQIIRKLFGCWQTLGAYSNRPCSSTVIRMETVGVDADSCGTSLPRFLKPVPSSQPSATHISVPVHAVYTHKHPFGDAHVLWWPAQTRPICDSNNKTVPTPRTILLFIPGTFSFPGR